MDDPIIGTVESVEHTTIDGRWFHIVNIKTADGTIKPVFVKAAI